MPDPTPTGLVPDAYPSAYTVTLLPPEHALYDFAAITVRLHAPSGLWSIDRLGHWLDDRGRWEQGTRRPADWYAERRFPLETARRLAEEAAPEVRLEAGTVADLCRAIAGEGC